MYRGNSLGAHTTLGIYPTLTRIQYSAIAKTSSAVSPCFLAMTSYPVLDLRDGPTTTQFYPIYYYYYYYSYFLLFLISLRGQLNLINGLWKRPSDQWRIMKLKVKYSKGKKKGEAGGAALAFSFEGFLRMGSDMCPLIQYIYQIPRT